MGSEDNPLAAEQDAGGWLTSKDAKTEDVQSSEAANNWSPTVMRHPFSDLDKS